MRAHDPDTVPLLDEARRRGSTALGDTPLPFGLDQFTIYTGLIGSALELGKLLATEERDLAAIGTHHHLRMAEIQSAFAQVETAMMADFDRDSTLRSQTFIAINLLIEKGQYEIAAEFHKRMLDGFSRPALETILHNRNAMAGAGGSRIRTV